MAQTSLSETITDADFLISDPDYDIEISPEYSGEDVKNDGFQPICYLHDRPIFDQNQVVLFSSLSRGTILRVKDVYYPDFGAVVLHGPVRSIKGQLEIRVKTHNQSTLVFLLADYSVVGYSQKIWAHHRYLIDTGRVSPKYLRHR